MIYYITGNYYLPQEEMEINAQYIDWYLRARGWSVNAIAAMLGNMQSESTINPGIWQNLDEGNTSLGYGLVQWTPATKLIEWANGEGLSYESMDAQLARIEYEVENGLQWIQTDTYPLTFGAFKVSTLSPFYLAGAFLHNYERPAEPDTQLRGSQADAWFTFLGGSGGSGGASPDTPVKKHELSLLMKYIATRR